MKAEQIKIELISWIASLKQNEWLNQLMEIKQRLEKDSQTVSKVKDPARIMRGYGKYAGQITMSDDFDEPLADFKDYM